jgi:hypothetical protein
MLLDMGTTACDTVLSDTTDEDSNMHIREKGNNLVCVRSVYNKDTQKSGQEHVCSLPSDTAPDAIPEQIKAKLSDRERLALEDKLDEMRRGQIVRNRVETLKKLPETLAHACEAMKRKLNWEMTSTQANEIYKGMRELENALKDAGYKKPKVADLEVKS